MGAATLYQLAKRGISTLGLDRFKPPHDLGSSHGETRITRCAVGEGEELIPLVQRSHVIWKELERETGENLLEECGFLMMAPQGVRTGHHGKRDFLNRTIAAAERHGIKHSRLDSAAIRAQFPAFLLNGEEEGYFEPGGGFVRPERCIAAQLDRAVELGTTLLTGTQVTFIQAMQGGVRVEAANGSVIQADRVVVAAGAWVGKLLGSVFAPVLIPRRQVLHWFPVADEGPFLPGICPSYIWMHGTQPDAYFYGFPAQPGSGFVKVATEQYARDSDPDQLDRSVALAERLAMYGTHVDGRLRGTAPAPGRSTVCPYTVTPDSGFVIDHHPDSERIIVVSPCSGHGFKHSAAIGEAVAQLATEGHSELDLEPFRLARLLGATG